MKWSIVLDKRADIFMNLNGAVDEVELPANDDDVYVHNTWTDSIPTVIHGNGPSKVSYIATNLLVDIFSFVCHSRKV
jgi:hypothetical protein